MVRVLFALLLFGGAVAGAQVAPAPRPIPPAKLESAAGPVSPATIDGPAEVDRIGVFRIANLPADAGVDWAWPDGLKVIEIEECVEKDYSAKVHVAGPPGAYTVKAKLIRFNPKTKRAYTTSLDPKTFTIKGADPPPPGPGPNPKPDPDPPAPAEAVTSFVVVEDTTKSGEWRGDILGSPEVVSFYHAKKLTHRILSAGAAGVDGALDPTGRDWVQKAAGKDLPWLFALNAAGQVVRSEKLLKTPTGVVAQLGGEAGYARKLGNLPPPDNKVRGVFPLFGSSPAVPKIPRAQWKPVNLEAYLPPVYDQDGVGACNAFATITVVEASRRMSGLPYIKLSPGFLYGAINGGSDQGSLLEDGLQWMTDKGTVRVSTVGYLDWRKGRSLMNNAAALSEAAAFRVVEAYECPSFDHIASALQQGFFIVEGLMWFDNFTPDRDGWLPARGAGGMGGHALCGYGLAQRNGAWGIRTRNSWSASWGVGGNCIIPESLFDNRIGGFWAVRSVVQNPQTLSRRRLVAPFEVALAF
jgi:hypothetical protein